MWKTTTLGSVLAIGLLAAPAGAQVKVGLMGGVNRSGYESPNKSVAHSSEMGVVAGGVVDLSLTDVLGLRLEPVYIRKSGSAEDAASRQEVTLKASFLEMPLFLRLAFGEATKPYFFAGPTLGVVLTSALSGSDSGVPYEGDLIDVTKRLDLGAGIGAGLSHPFGRLSTFVEARYVWGFTNLQKGGEVLLSSPGTSVTVPLPVDRRDDEYEYRGLQILLGFTVPLKVGGRGP